MVGRGHCADCDREVRCFRWQGSVLAVTLALHIVHDGEGDGCEGASRTPRHLRQRSLAFGNEVDGGRAVHKRWRSGVHPKGALGARKVVKGSVVVPAGMLLQEQ